jgi:hypothetical protein
MLETFFPRIEGDMGHAKSFGFPVAYNVVRGAIPRKVVGGDRSLLEPVIEAARELEAMGVRAITTNCGFLALFQKELAENLSVPVFTSSLMLVPFAHRIIPPGKRVGIIVADSTQMTEGHFNAVGWSSHDIPVRIYGLERCAEFVRAVLENSQDMDWELFREEFLSLVREIPRNSPEVGALVLECTDTSPFAAETRKVLGLPVFDITALIRLVWETVAD